MERSGLRLVAPRVARASIAGALARSTPHPALGSIDLHRHQLDAAALVRQAIGEFGGALLCDPVGTGKTFTALAVARDYERIVVAAPAALRAMWLDAAARTGLSISFVSHEALSRNSARVTAPHFVIVDEAHHLRNSRTQRFRALARLARNSPVLLLTATPIHNRGREMMTLLSLFAGERAHTLGDSEIATVAIGRQPASQPGVPVVAPVKWLRTAPDDELVDELLSLPPPAPVRGGGVGANLIVRALIRLWASSDAALMAGLTRRMQRAAALTSALESGTYPSRTELAAWTIGDDAVQLAFAELLAPRSEDCEDLLAAVRAHSAAVERLRSRVRDPSPRDAECAAILSAIRERHAGVPVVAFSQYEDTVASLYRALAAQGGVAALSGRGGMVAGGTISRQDVIARFAPVANGGRLVSQADAVSLLITTDLLSEGFNLQDAGVVVHLDLPWTPARVQQRVGRAARLGSSRRQVYSYALHPPASAEAVIRIEGILETKLCCIGAAESLTRVPDRLRSTLARWRTVPAIEEVASFVSSARRGFLAIVRTGDRTAMLCGIDDSISDEPEALLQASALAEGDPAPADMALLQSQVAAIGNHLAASDALGALPAIRSPYRDLRPALLRRIARIAGRARACDRPRIGALAMAARQAVTGRSGAFIDGHLDELSRLASPDDEWLMQLARCRPTGQPDAHRDWKIVAIIVFAVPDG